MIHSLKTRIEIAVFSAITAAFVMTVVSVPVGPSIGSWLASPFFCGEGSRLTAKVLKYKYRPNQRGQAITGYRCEDGTGAVVSRYDEGFVMGVVFAVYFVPFTLLAVIIMVILHRRKLAKSSAAFCKR